MTKGVRRKFSPIMNLRVGSFSSLCSRVRVDSVFCMCCSLLVGRKKRVERVSIKVKCDYVLRFWVETRRSELGFYPFFFLWIFLLPNKIYEQTHRHTHTHKFSHIILFACVCNIIMCVVSLFSSSCVPTRKWKLCKSYCRCVLP